MRDRPLRPSPVAASFKSGRSRHVNLYPRPSLVFGRVLRGTAMEICQEPAPAMRTPLSTLYMRPLPLTLHALDSEAARFKYPPHWVPLEALFAAMLGPRRRDRPAPRLAQLARQAARATRPLCL